MEFIAQSWNDQCLRGQSPTGPSVGECAAPALRPLLLLFRQRPLITWRCTIAEPAADRDLQRMRGSSRLLKKAAELLSQRSAASIEQQRTFARLPEDLGKYYRNEAPKRIIRPPAAPQAAPVPEASSSGSVAPTAGETQAMGAHAGVISTVSTSPLHSRIHQHTLPHYWELADCHA